MATQAAAWNHAQFPVVIELMKVILEPAVRACGAIKTQRAVAASIEE